MCNPFIKKWINTVWWAIALANRVFPVPGGPYNKTPFGYEIPKLSNISGCLIGNSITSFTSLTYWSKPPIISYVESGTFSTFINDTNGSTLVGNILWSTYESDFNATLVFGLHSSIFIDLSTVTTYFPSGFTFTKTLFFPICLITSPTYEWGSYNAYNSSLTYRTIYVGILYMIQNYLVN